MNKYFKFIIISIGISTVSACMDSYPNQGKVEQINLFRDPISVFSIEKEEFEEWKLFSLGLKSYDGEIDQIVKLANELSSYKNVKLSKYSNSLKNIKHLDQLILIKKQRNLSEIEKLEKNK